MHHDLKAEPESYKLLALRISSVQLRKNDRDFAVGDTCAFQEYTGGYYTGHSVAPVKIVELLEKHEGLTAEWCLIVLDLPATNITRFSGTLAGKSNLQPAVKS